MTYERISTLNHPCSTTSMISLCLGVNVIFVYKQVHGRMSHIL